MTIDDLPEDEQQELFEHHHFKVDKGQHPLRIDKFLSEKISTSRNKIQNAATAGSILVNNRPVKSNFNIRPLDEISIVLPYAKRETEILPENIPLDIFYEDDDLIIINKPSELVVHPGHGNYTGTLLNALLWHTNQAHPGPPKGRENQPTIKTSDLTNNSTLTKYKIPIDADKRAIENGAPLPSAGARGGLPFLVHRIDKNTTGLIVAAKNEVAMIHLAKQFFEKSIDRKYHALVWGDLAEDEGTITGNIGRSLKDRKIMQVFPDGEFGKTAITHYKVLERFGYLTLVECKLETGRTHQIRAHFKYIGHPLFNDEKYGGGAILKGTVFTKYKQFVENCFKMIPRQALHAKSLGFIHPSTKKKMFFESELPEDMKAVIGKWRNYAVHKKEKKE